MTEAKVITDPKQVQYLEAETSPQEIYQRMISMAGSPLERLQIALSFNHDYISQRCYQYERDTFAWKWREDFW